MILGQNDPKKVAAMILIKKGDGSAESKDESKSIEKKTDMDMGLVAAADDIMSSIEKKDSEGVAIALKSFIEMCGSYSEEEGGE